MWVCNILLKVLRKAIHGTSLQYAYFPYMEVFVLEASNIPLVVRRIPVSFLVAKYILGIASCISKQLPTSTAFFNPIVQLHNEKWLV